MLKTSNFIKTQLPNFISDSSDYNTFVEFLKSYYDWMYEEKGVLLESQNLLKYQSIEETLDEFIDYFYNEFMPSFPKDVIADRRKLLKYSKEFYSTKGTPASFKFLFRVLYNSSCEIIETEDFVLKASSGEWFVPKSIVVKTTDKNILKLNNYYVFGLTSKTLAKIEYITFNGTRAEIFISEIKRNFTNNENIEFLNHNLHRIYFDSTTEEPTTSSSDGYYISPQIVSSISSAHIYPKYRGTLYNTGNPIVFYGGGINGASANIEAKGYVGDISEGKITSVVINSPAKNHGYTLTTTGIYFDKETNKNSVINVTAVDIANTISLNYIVKDSLESYANTILYCDVISGETTNTEYSYGFTTLPNSNCETIMSEAFSFASFDTHPLSELTVMQSERFVAEPTLQAICSYETNTPVDANSSSYDARYTFGSSNTFARLPDLGILGPIIVETSGTGYNVGDEILISGIGTGAFAKITAVNSNGGIISAAYYQKENVPAPLGGFGFYQDSDPTLTIQGNIKTANTTNGSNVVIITSTDLLANVKIGQSITGNGIPSLTTISSIYTGNNSIVISNLATQNTISNTYVLTGMGASLYPDGILGGQADLGVTIDTIGAISTLNLTEYGEDYIIAPEVSLRVEDFVVTNVELFNMPTKGTKLYQTGVPTRYESYFDSATLIESNVDPLLSKYIFRTYNYNKSVDITAPLYVSDTITFNIVSDYVFPVGYNGIETSANGVVTFGNGLARGYSKFLSGLRIGNGQYISNKGFLSSYNVLQNEVYNNHTYILAVEKEIQKYRQIVLDLLHPAGTKLLGQVSIETGNETEIDPTTSHETYFSDTLTDFPPMLGIALSTEDWKALLFDTTENRYGTWIDSTTIKLSDFPAKIVPNYKVYGTGFDWATINSVSYLANTITCNVINSSGNTINDVEFIIQDNGYYGTFNDPTEVYNRFIVYGDITTGCNVITINTRHDNVLANISIGDVICCEPTRISANITNNSFILSNVVSYGPIANGQYISARYIPNGTKILYYYSGNSTIVMTNSATGNSNSSVTYYNSFVNDYVTEIKYINLYDIPEGTTITNINNKNKTITISNTSLMTSNLFYMTANDIFLIAQTPIDIGGE